MQQHTALSLAMALRYVLIEVTSGGRTQHCVRGVVGADYHADAAQPTVELLDALNVSCEDEYHPGARLYLYCTVLCAGLSWYGDRSSPGKPPEVKDALSWVDIGLMLS